MTKRIGMEIKGFIERGAGKGAFFTTLDWVVAQFEKEMGFKPFPGTLNVKILPEDLSKLEDFFGKEDFKLVPDDPSFCTAGFRKVRVGGIPAAAVFPGEEVRIHGKDVIEIMADRHIKDSLGLNDGDPVTITDF